MILTERLVLRPPVPGDRAALHAMWADPRVMADMDAVKTPEQSDAAIARHASYRAQGLGFWVAESRADGAFAGFCGLKPGAPDTPIEGEVEIGWMLVPEFWGRGLAREAAAAWIEWGWANTEAPRIAAITSARNDASRRLMERLGMAEIATFEHPMFAADDPLRFSVAHAVERPA